MTHHVLDQLPLWTEGDLSGLDAETVQAHLDLCDSCRDAAERLRTSQAWLREALAPPFVPIDHENLRRAVMAQVRTEAAAKPLQRLMIRRGLLATCAALLLIATFIWRRERPAVAPAPGVPSPLADLRPGAEPTREAPPRLAHHSPARILSASTRPRTAVAPADSPPEEPTRIEFQTSDPNIRIIWLTRSTPLPDTNSPLQEEP